MDKHNLNEEEKNEEKKIKTNSSSSDFSDFVKHHLPKEEEVEEFDEIVNKEVRQEEIDQNLNEIYKDRKGNIIDVKRVDIKKGPGFILRFFKWLIFLAIIGYGAYFAYNYWFNNNGNDNSIKFTVSAPEKVVAGEEFFYTISYKNLSQVSLKNLKLEVKYPDNFVFLDSFPLSSKNNNSWYVEKMFPGEEEIIKVKGKIVNKKGSVNTINAIITYYPENFSSEFKKEVAQTIMVSDLGFDFSLDFTNPVIVNENTDLGLIFVNHNPYLSSFNLVIDSPDNIVISTDAAQKRAEEIQANVAASSDESDLAAKTNNEKGSNKKSNTTNTDTISTSETDSTVLTTPTEVSNTTDVTDISGKTKTLITKTDVSNLLGLKEIKNKVWQVVGVNKDESRQKISLKYKVAEKIADSQRLNFRLEYEAENGKTYSFLEDGIDLEIMRSDLNLTLAINDNKTDKPINFNQTLNYAITYNNKGEMTMKDVIIMAVLDGDFIDWKSFKDDEYEPMVRGKTITWTKDEVPGLAELKPNQEGVLNFSIKLKSFSDEDYATTNFKINSYAQYSFGNIDDVKEKIDAMDNRSNSITSVINSNLDLKEEILYFNNDNVPVGKGPLPPKVGEKTTFKVSWTLTNNLHELTETGVEMLLPQNVSFEGNQDVSTGSLFYDSATNKIIWDLGRFPVTVYKATANFELALTPEVSDSGKIVVLSPGAEVRANDSETRDAINFKTQAKTSKLEDDSIAALSNDGIVR
ncbi:MAG: hypothetical protein MUF50_02360 [Planctomycetes bacterium]|jgi:hypothetical protein|nr:hypothetical protein [Planctomycetota bacterium]